ncbi:uncharacterized protein LOC144079043 [Stigmatopora argus]
MASGVAAPPPYTLSHGLMGNLVIIKGSSALHSVSFLRLSLVNIRHASPCQNFPPSLVDHRLSLVINGHSSPCQDFPPSLGYQSPFFTLSRFSAFPWLSSPRDGHTAYLTSKKHQELSRKMVLVMVTLRS